jgi:leucyl-tRNA synthetase
MGPLETQKPWNTRDIIGMSRFLSAVWRNLVGDEEAGKMATIYDEPIPESIDRQMHRTIKKVGEDIEALRFNTAIAALIILNNEMTTLKTMPKSLAENFTLMLAPFAPHIAEELWSRLGHNQTLAHHPWPKFDEKKLVDNTMELAVQVNGKLRGTITVRIDQTQDNILRDAAQVPTVKTWLEGKMIMKQLYVPKKLVNFVVK